MRVRGARGSAELEVVNPVFARLRIRLALLYCVLLGATLLVCGVLLYVGLQRMLLDPVQNDLIRRADHLGIEWQTRPAAGCRQPGYVSLAGRQQSLKLTLPLQNSLALGLRTRFYSVCFDTRGHVRPLNGRLMPLRLLQPDLSNRALRDGTATDTVDAGEGVGNIRRYAEVVPDDKGPGILGVVVVAVSVEGQLAALHAVLILLIVLGMGTLTLAGLGGLVLSGRAMEPVRIALARQREFVAAAAHELRTPLTILRADAEVLLRATPQPSAEATALLQDMVSECGHMTALTETMLSLARLDAGQGHYEREVLSCQVVLEQIARRADSLARHAGVALKVVGGPPISVLADPILLDQILLILLDNAVKYNHAGGSVTLSVSQSQGNAVFAVADTGLGIAAADIAHLGERFFRVDKDRSRASGGAGLGLSIARQIARQLGGTLEYESLLGQGTTVRLILPMLRAGHGAPDLDGRRHTRVIRS